METEEKKKTPILKKKWFWIVIAVILVIGIIGNVVKGDNSDAAERPSASPSVETPAPTPTATPEPSNNQGVVSLDDLCVLVESTITDYYTGCSVTHDENSITVNVWIDGIAAAVLYTQSVGGGADDENWISAKEGTLALAESLCKLIDTSGYENVYLNLNVLNDQNRSNVLLSILDTTIIYDVLAG